MYLIWKLGSVSKLLTILGSLCVPPAPGNSPNITSGVPRIVFLLLVATRYWQVMANWEKKTSVSDPARMKYLLVFFLLKRTIPWVFVAANRV